MTITPDSTVVNLAAPDMTRDAFTASLRGTPAENEASAIYDAVARHRVSHAFVRAVFRHESSDGTDGICADFNTKSMGNTRSSRTGKGTVFTVPGRGPFVRYDTWTDGADDLAFRLVDPTYRYAREGRTTIRRILEIYAPSSDNNDPDAYARAVSAHMNQLIDEVPEMAAQIPGFAWQPADANHFRAGRTERIRGGAQHYTAGTNSLNWLTTTSDPPVSATFLVKHDATPADRGWQLVRIEDTAWTTAFANPYTVSIEYEHTANQKISDQAYEALAQTWADVTRYVQQHNLGAIETVKGHKEWVNNPSLICPDGIDVGRIVRRWQEMLKPAGDPRDLGGATPDPFGSPYGSFWVENRFLDRWRKDFMRWGHVISGAFTQWQPDGSDYQLVQYFERGRMEINADGSITDGLVGYEAFVARKAA